MVKLGTLLELHPDRQPPIVVFVQATTWWEIVHGHVKLMEGGRGVHLHVKVCCRAVARYFKGGVAKVYLMYVVSRMVWGACYPKNVVKLDTQKMLLRSFLGPKATCSNFYQTACEITIAGCA